MSRKGRGILEIWVHQKPPTESGDLLFRGYLGVIWGAYFHRSYLHDAATYRADICRLTTYVLVLLNPKI